MNRQQCFNQVLDFEMQSWKKKPKQNKELKQQKNPNITKKTQNTNPTCKRRTQVSKHFKIFLTLSTCIMLTTASTGQPSLKNTLFHIVSGSTFWL